MSKKILITPSNIMCIISSIWWNLNIKYSVLIIEGWKRTHIRGVRTKGIRARLCREKREAHEQPMLHSLLVGTSSGRWRLHCRDGTKMAPAECAGRRRTDWEEAKQNAPRRSDAAGSRRVLSSEPRPDSSIRLPSCRPEQNTGRTEQMKSYN